MCGIAVIHKRDGSSLAREDLARMASLLHHRGPDEAGYVILDQGSTGFAHTRLSILDIASGQQPMRDAGHRAWITFNGEIYNHEDLRKELRGLGQVFRTRSDTEVLLGAWNAWGEGMLERLNGEFAFVIHDIKKRSVFAARDAAGVKPLFYRLTEQELLIASEAKAILGLERVPRALSRAFLTGPFLGVYPETVSAFEGIESLEPGGCLRIHDGRFEKRRWWRLKFTPDEKMDFEEARRGFRHEFEKAVLRRSHADVPVQVYLSGGVDSTAIAAALVRARGAGNPLTAYHISFAGSELDEAPVASRIARALGVDLDVIAFRREDLVTGLERAVFHTELPIANPNTLSKLALSGLVRARGDKVCLTGEGADELLGGYAYFKLEQLWIESLRGGVRGRGAEQLLKAFERQEQRSKGVSWYPGLPWRKGPYRMGYPCFNEYRASKARGAQFKLLDHRRLGLTESDDPWGLFTRMFSPETLGSQEPFDISREIAFHQLTGYLIPNLGDRVEMANSVECRTPFLDRSLMDFVSRVPTRHLLDLETLREKKLLHAAVADLLPPFMSEIHKHPFLAPGWSEIRESQDGRALFDEYLSARAIREAGVLSARTYGMLQFLWPLLPRQSLLRKQLDLILGLGLSLQVLHRTFISKRPESRTDYPMVDRGTIVG
jgi:asparagine synthase (glutamine-hydrolysing)